MKYGDNNVITGPVVIIWDGITQPETKEDKAKGPFLQYSLKCAAHNQAPELLELDAIARAALQADTTFRGQLPPGGNWPLVANDPNKYEGKLVGYTEFNTKTRRLPQVIGMDGKELPAQVYGPMLYPGAIVRLILSAYTFNNVSKGVTFSLNGIQIIDASTPRLPVGGVDAVAGFNSAAPPAYAPPQGAPPAYAPPQGAPPAYAPPQAAPPAYAPPQAAPPAYAPPQAAPPAYAPPQAAPPAAPAHDYIAGPGTPGMAPPPMAPAPVHHQMTAAATASYDGYIASGWTDDLLRQHGLML